MSSLVYLEFLKPAGGPADVFILYDIYFFYNHILYEIFRQRNVEQCLTVTELSKGTHHTQTESD